MGIGDSPLHNGDGVRGLREKVSRHGGVRDAVHSDALSEKTNRSRLSGWSEP